MTDRRIGLAINGRFLAQPVSGVQRYARELLQALDALLAGEGGAIFPSVTLFVPPNVSTEALPRELKVTKIQRAGRLKGHLWEQIELPRMAHESILVSLTNSAPLMHPCQLIVIHDAAIVQCPSDYNWRYRAWYRALYAGLRLTSARFISVSAFAADDVSRHFGIARDRISVVSNAAEHFDGLKPDRSLVDRLGLAENGYILAVGSQSARKNLSLIDRALAGFENPPLLVIAGGGASRAFTAPGALATSGAIHLDHVSDAAIAGLYRSALCLAFPSRYEGFGLPPVEAMACGCPVITSHAASMPEICGDAVLYCDPERPDTLANGIRKLMTDPDARSRLIARGRERIRLYSWERSAGKLLEAVAQRLATA